MLLEDAAKNSLLTDEQKVYFLTRYVYLVNHYRKKYRRTNFLYNSLRISVMVGSIFIPALLTLQKDPETIISITTYWTVFALSLLVTLSNSLLELFNIAALNTKYWLHVQRLETEGWQYLNLTDSYSRYNSLTDGYRKFTSRVEKLHLSLVFDLLRLENKAKTSTKAEGNGSVDPLSMSVITNNSSTRNSVTPNSVGEVSQTTQGSVTRQLFNALQPLQPLQPQDTLSHDGSVQSYDLGEDKGSESKANILVSLQEFQSRLGLDRKEVWSMFLCRRFFQLQTQHDGDKQGQNSASGKKSACSDVTGLGSGVGDDNGVAERGHVVVTCLIYGMGNVNGGEAREKEGDKDWSSQFVGNFLTVHWHFLFDT